MATKITSAVDDVDWETLINVAGDILAFQIIPHSASLTARFLINKEQYDWYYQDVRRPFWDIFGKYMNGIFSLIHTSVGVASYLIYISDTEWYMQATPLVLCGVQMLLDFTWRPLFFNQKNWDRSFRQSLANTVFSAGICYLYHKVDERAGYCFLPYPIWWFYLTTVVWYVRIFNDPPEPWRRLSFGGSPMLRRPSVPGGSISDWLESGLYYLVHMDEDRESGSISSSDRDSIILAINTTRDSIRHSIYTLMTTVHDSARNSIDSAVASLQENRDSTS